MHASTPARPGLSGRPPTRSRAAALALALSLAGGSAGAAERWWTFIGGCASADWRGMVSGSNAEGRATCWAASSGGPSGALPPNAGDDVFIVANAAVDLLVPYAAAGRPPYAGLARDLVLDSSGGTGAVGLSFAATLDAATTTLGLQRNLVVGQAGRGRLDQAGGGLGVAGTAVLGATAGSSGELRLSGGTLAVTGAMTIGRSGSGSLLMSGGSASTGALSVGSLSGSQGLLQITAGTLTSSITSSVGQAGDSSGTVTLSGTGARWTNTGSLGVGLNGTGSITVSDGGRLDSVNTVVGLGSGGRGSIALAGSGTRWDDSAVVQLGVGGQGTVSVGAGAVFKAASLIVGSGGTLVLDGGELALQQGTLGNGLDWRTGTLRITTASGATVGSGLLAGLAPLRSGQTLVVDGPLFVGAGVLALSGGAVRATALGIDGGVVAAGNGSVVNVSDVGILFGQGTVAAPIRGGAGSRIETQTGVLTLGSANSTEGFVFDGRITANGRQIVLLDRDAAQLGGFTELQNGGSLAAPNGLLLDTGRMLQFSGSASIEGRFTHRGSISPQAAGTLTFFDDVTGTGSFAGAIVFKGVYSPGAAGLAASVGFGGGTLDVGASGVLQMDIGGPGGVGGTDRLTGLARLSFAGALQLDVAAGTVLPAGTVIRLFEAGSFGGSFDPARISVNGFDRTLLDFSRLGVDGSIAVVPEAATWSLWCAGLALLAWRRGVGRRPA